MKTKTSILTNFLLLTNNPHQQKIDNYTKKNENIFIIFIFENFGEKFCGILIGLTFLDTLLEVIF